MKLYTWQRECLKAWESNGCRGIAHVATGAGKTVLALAAIDLFFSRFPNAQIRVVVPTIPLAQQWQTALAHHLNDMEKLPAFFGGGIRDNPESPVMIYIINSARDALAGHIRRSLAQGRPVFLICDECHHYQSPKNRRIFQYASPAFSSGKDFASLGLSATPFGTAHDEILTEALGPEIYRYDFEDASSDGIVSSFMVGEVSVSFLEKERTEYEKVSSEIRFCFARLMQAYPQLKGLSAAAFMKEVRRIAGKAEMNPADPAAAYLLKLFKRREISSLAQARIQCGLDLIDQFPEKPRILVFCERISQAELFAAALRRRRAGLCALYHSGMSKDARARNMQAFRDGSVRILVACRCLDEGIDVPDASVGVVLSSSAVPRQRIQRLGRILRRSPDKEAACLYYLFIRESVDDSVYLQGIHAERTFSLRYSPKDHAFSNDLYEYVATGLLHEGKTGQMDERLLRELRRCLVAGLARPDYLLPEESLKKRQKAADNIRESNYWKTMLKIHNAF